MRVIIFFDLPMETVEEKKDYRSFRKYLINDGFIMLQKSVYSKLILNLPSANLLRKKIENNKPGNGLVQILVITEKQFASMDHIVGNSKTDIIDSAERLIIL